MRVKRPLLYHEQWYDQWGRVSNADDIAYGNHGTLQGGAVLGIGKVDLAFTFDSDDDRVTIGSNPNLDVQPGGFSVDFWMQGVKNQPDSFQSTIFEKSHGWVDSTGWAFQVRSTTGLPLFAIGNGSAFPEITGSVDVLDGNFHHIAGTWDGATMRLYVDGVLQGSASNSTPASNGRDVNIGFTWGGGTPRRFFRGVVDELELFNRALLATEIQAIVDAGSLGKCKDEDGDGFRPAEDCDETNAAINPDAVELPGNFVDENCDGSLGDVDPCFEWKSHGEYIRNVAHAVNDLVAAGILTEEEGDALISSAAISKTGKKGFIPVECQ